MSDVITTMSYGDDVSHAITLLVGNEKAIGETVHIAGARAVTWDNVNQIYCNTLNVICGSSPDYVFIDDWKNVSRNLGKYYQIKYARSISRRFDNSKLEALIGTFRFVDPDTGLKECLMQFLEGERRFRNVSWKAEAYFNKVTKDRLKDKNLSKKDRVKYLIGRYTPYFHLKSK